MEDQRGVKGVGTSFSSSGMPVNCLLKVIGSVISFFWGPDSSGIYNFQGAYPVPQQLMHVPVPEGTPRLIHPDSGLERWYWPARFVEGP